MLKLWKALIQTQKSLSDKKGHLQYRSLSKGWEPLEVRSLLSVTPYNYGEINIGNIEFDADVTAKFELETIENTSTSQEVQDAEYQYTVTIPGEGEEPDTTVVYTGIQSFSKTTEMIALTEDNWTYEEIVTWSYTANNGDTDLLGSYTYTFIASCINDVYSFTFDYESEDQTVTTSSGTDFSYQSVTTLVSTILIESEIDDTDGSGSGSDTRTTLQTNSFTGEETYRYFWEEETSIPVEGIYHIQEQTTISETTEIDYTKTSNVWSENGTYSMSESGASDSSYTESGDYLETYSNLIDTGKIIGVINANGSTQDSWNSAVSGVYSEDVITGNMVWTYTGLSTLTSTENKHWNQNQSGAYTRNYTDENNRGISLKGTDHLGYTNDETTVSTVTSSLSSNGQVWVSAGISTTTQTSDSSYSSDLHGTYVQFLGTTPVTGYVSTHLNSNETDTSSLVGTLSSVTGEWTYAGTKDVAQTGSYNNDITFDNIVYTIAITDGTLSGKLGALQTSWAESDFNSHFVLDYDENNEEDIWVLTSGSGTYANGIEEGESCDAFGTYTYLPLSGNNETVQSMSGTIHEYARNAYGVGVKQTFTVTNGEWSEVSAVELETSTERSFYEDIAEGEYEFGDISGDLGRMESAYYESRAIYEVTLNAQNAVTACTVGNANVVSVNTSRRWLKGTGTLEIDPEPNYSASSYNVLPWSGNYNENEDSFYREIILENYELDNPEDYLDTDFEADWQFDTGSLQVTNKYRTEASYSGTRNEWCDQNHYYDYLYGEGFDLPASSYSDTWEFENIYAEDSDILYALTESLLVSSASGSGSGSGEGSLSLDVISGYTTTQISNKIKTSTIWDDREYTWTDDDGMVISGTEDSTSRYAYNRDMRIAGEYVGSASVTPASGEFLEDGWLVRGSGKILEATSENGAYTGSASYDYTPDYYTYSSASGSYTESGNWRDNHNSELTLTFKQSSDPTADNYWHITGSGSGVSIENYSYSLSASQTFTWDTFAGTQNESGHGSYRANSHYKVTYDNEQSDEWTLASGSGKATEDYTYQSALSASGSYSLSLENGSASIYGTSASNDSLTWHDRTEYQFSVLNGEWQTDMKGRTRQTETSASTYWCSGSGSGFSGNATSGNSWSAHASEAGAFSRSAVTQIDWSYQNGSYSAVGNVHTDFDASGEYAYSGENDSWWSESNSHSSGWYSFDDDNHNERESNETMVFHHERDENYEWSLDETGRVYVSGYSYTQSGSMSANGHRGGSGTHNYESSSYTQGDGWSSFYHSGSFGSGYFYDDYDFTADWSESFNGVTNSYSSAHSASNDVEGYEYNLSGYFSDYYNTWTGQNPDSGSYSDSYPSSNSYASTVTENGFSFTWNGWDVQTRQGVYIHNTPYSGIWDIPFGLGSWTNPVEQPNSAWSSEPIVPEPYSSPSQRYVDDLDDFFYGYDNSDLYETGLQEYGEVTVTNASGSASYSGYESFYDDFTDGSVGNEGVGSGLSTLDKHTAKTAFNEVFDDAGDNSSEFTSFLSLSPIGIPEKLTTFNTIAHGLDEFNSTAAQEVVKQFNMEWPADLIKITDFFGTTPDKIYQQGVKRIISIPSDIFLDQLRNEEEYRYWSANYYLLPSDIPTSWEHQFGNWDFGRFTLSLGLDNPDFQFNREDNLSLSTTVQWGIGIDIPSLFYDQSRVSIGLGIGTNFQYTYMGDIDIDTSDIVFSFHNIRKGTNMFDIYLTIDFSGNCHVKGILKF